MTILPATAADHKIDWPAQAPTGYQQRQRARAEEMAPPGPVSEEQFRQACRGYSIPVLRQASMRYSSARGRTYTLVIDRFVEALQNRHVNRGDDYRIVLGHIAATHSERARWGIS